VRRGCGAAAARQNELLEGGQGAVPSFQGCLQFFHVFFGQQGVSRDGQFAAKIEQIVLDLLQHRSPVVRDLLREHDADGAVQLVDVAERRDARAVLRHAGAVAQARLAGVAGAGGDLREAVAH
jgi:hypothetical protein